MRSMSARTSIPPGLHRTGYGERTLGEHFGRRILRTAERGGPIERAAQRDLIRCRAIVGRVDDARGESAPRSFGGDPDAARHELSDRLDESIQVDLFGVAHRRLHVRDGLSGMRIAEEGEHHRAVQANRDV